MAFNSGASSGNLVKIQSQTASGASALTFVTGINTTYDDYVIRVKGLVCTGATFLYGQFSIDAGANWLTGAGYNNNGAYSHSASQAFFYVAGQTQMRLTDNLPTAAGTQMGGVIEFFDISSGSYRPACLSRFQSAGAINNMTYYGNAYTTAAVAVNGIKILTNAGTFSGTFILYGVEK